MSLSSPAVKRQKTASGYSSTANNSPAETGAYNSENDDGDELFKDYIPDTPKHGFQTQPTQILPQSAVLPSKTLAEHDTQNAPQTAMTNGYQTQPTQIVTQQLNGLRGQSPSQAFPKAYETQPTQILDLTSRSSPPQTPHKRDVQVPASSPFTSQASPLGAGGSTTPQTQNAPRTFASMMAPAGTMFRPPMPIVKKSPTKTMIDLTAEDAPTYIGGDSSSDDERDSRANIQPSYFGPLGGQTTKSDGGSKFQHIMKNAVYQPPNKGLKQTRPDRARPVEATDLTPEARTRDYIVRIRKVLPHISMRAAESALLVCKGNLDDAIVLLGGDDDEEDAPGEVVEISDDELGYAKPKDQPQMMRGLAAPTVSIRNKYSSTQSNAKNSSQVATPPRKPKRKLMQGRRHPSSPAVPAASSPLKPQVEVLEEDDYDSDDSGVASASEEDPELDDRVLKYLNSCKVEDLIELTNTTKENADDMMNARPFRNLDAARTVESTKTTKSGKRSKKAPIGDKIVDNALDMFAGYTAIDELCTTCETLGKGPSEEMKKWGFDVFGASKDGELEMTSMEDDAESLRDSGIGSPSSAASPKPGDDEDIRIAATKRKRSNVNFLKKPDLMSESTILKDYQVVGLNWLALMYRQKLSCILADEMGLGKTCQVIAFLCHLVEIGRPGPHLVVCPGSTLENWLRECQNFAPQLRFEPYHGMQKERGEMADNILANRESINVVVTTYDMAAKKEDNKFMKRLKPDVCVYDEGHYLKNPNSQRYAGLVKIPATFRLLLTGTPLQNNLQELAALLAFIMPDVFAKHEESLQHIFKAKATTRDADHAALLSAQRIGRARQMLTPFVLRRKKDQVLKHLPAKTARVEYTTLHPAQKEIYDGHIEQARERARVRIEGGRILKSDENNPLMQLRKAAIHPLLFRRHFTNAKIEKMCDILRKKEPVNFPSDKNHKREHLIQEMQNGSDYWLHGWCREYPCIRSYDIPDLAWMNSGKVEALVKLLKTYKENGDRCLIFSQFALVLDILQSVLNTSLISFTRIDGSTKIDERQSLIDQFRDDETITVFLLTTKAGGTGINLMYANKVIIFDGSFNPQDDRQAENRAHRVGQTRDVEVVRLVTKGTVEEQIYALGQSKLVLDGRVAGDDAEAELAGEKAISKMLLEGTTVADDDGDEAKLDGEEVKETKVVDKGKEIDLPKRKKGSFLAEVVNAEKEKGDEDEEMLV